MVKLSLGPFAHSPWTAGKSRTAVIHALSAHSTARCANLPLCASVVHRLCITCVRTVHPGFAMKHRE